jgi:hypothetical protein
VELDDDRPRVNRAATEGEIICVIYRTQNQEGEKVITLEEREAKQTDDTEG